MKGAKFKKTLCSVLAFTMFCSGLQNMCVFGEQIDNNIINYEGSASLSNDSNSSSEGGSLSDFSNSSNDNASDSLNSNENTSGDSNSLDNDSSSDTDLSSDSMSDDSQSDSLSDSDSSDNNISDISNENSLNDDSSNSSTTQTSNLTNNDISADTSSSQAATIHNLSNSSANNSDKSSSSVLDKSQSNNQLKNNITVVQTAVVNQVVDTTMVTEDATTDTSTDSWYENYVNSTVVETDSYGDGTSGYVTLGHFNNTSYAGELLVYGVVKISGKYYHVNLMESNAGGVGNSSDSSWHSKAPGVTAIHFVKGSEDGAYSSGYVTTGSGCRGMFRDLPALTTLDLAGMDLSAATNMGHFFCKCPLLSYITFGVMPTAVTDVTHLFGYCTGLKFVNLSGFDFSNVTAGYSDAFSDCTNLETILTPKNINGNFRLNTSSSQYYFLSAADKEAYEAGDTSKAYQYLPTGLSDSVRLMRYPTDDPQYAVSIDITTVADPPAIYIGEYSQVTAKVTWDNASQSDEVKNVITWESSDESVATIDSEGKAYGLKPGTVWITARYVADPSVWGRCSVTVMDDPVIDNRMLSVIDNRGNQNNTGLTEGSVTKLNGNRFLLIEDLEDTTEITNYLDDVEYDKIACYDINLFYNKNGPDKDNDFGSCNIIMTVPDEMDLSNGSVSVVSVKDDALETLSDVEILENDDGIFFVCFKTTHFSPYAVLYTAGEEELAPSDSDDSEPISEGDNSKTETVIERISETLTYYVNEIVYVDKPVEVVKEPAFAPPPMLNVSPVTGEFSGAPPGGGANVLSVCVILLLIVYMLGSAQKLDLPFEIKIVVEEQVITVIRRLKLLYKTISKANCINGPPENLENLENKGFWFVYAKFA